MPILRICENYIFYSLAITHTHHDTFSTTHTFMLHQRYKKSILDKYNLFLEKCENISGKYFSKFVEVELGIRGWRLAAQEWGCTLQFFTREKEKYFREI